VLNDGRRQIGFFYLPGDVFGLEVGDSTVSRPKRSATGRCWSSKRSSVIAFGRRETDVARQLWEMTAPNCGGAGSHLLLIKTSQGASPASLEMAATRGPVDRDRYCRCRVRTSQISRPDHRNRFAR